MFMDQVVTPQSICRFGLARCDVTPPVGIYHRIWGAASHDRATGVHRPLTATAMVFRPPHGEATSDTEQVLVAIDHCLLWAREMEALLGSLSRQTGLAKEQLAFAFSHTHSAGLMGLERVGLPGGDLIPPYLNHLAERLAEIIQGARRAVQPATIVYGVGRCSMAGNRDFWDEQSKQYVCGFNPEGPADDTVVVARVSNDAGQPLATIVNYACHPTTLAWQNSLISPDFPGAMREVIERATAVPCAFLQGASGDLGPREGFVGDTAVADRNGRQLGYAALAALEALPPPGTNFQFAGPVISGATLGAWEHVPLTREQREQAGRWQLRRITIDLPYRSGLYTMEQVDAEDSRWKADEQTARQAGDLQRAADCRAMVERMTRWRTRIQTLPPGKTFALPVTLWRMGDAVWVCLEGEHYQYLQTALRERFPGVPIMISTVTNGSRPIYLPTRETYGKGIYQESIAVLAPGSLEKLIEGVAAVVQEIMKNDE